MLKKIWVLMLIILVTLPLNANAEDSDPILIKAHATAYCLPGRTASGTEVREGICAMSDPSLIGMTAVVYQRMPDGSIGNYIGTYEIEDTGCSDNVIDVWCTEEDCQGFMDKVYENGCKGKVFVQIVDAKG